MLKTLANALQLIDLLSLSKEALSVQQLADKLQLGKSSTAEIVSTLEHFNYLTVQGPEGAQRCRLSMRFLEIAQSISSSCSLHQRALNLITELSELTGEMVYLGVPERDQVMYLDGALPQPSLSAKPVIGMTAPLTCTGIGKAMLAYFSEERIDAILKAPIERFTDNTITDPVLLKEELRMIRSRGYSVDNMEHEFGIKCVAVPLFDAGHRLMGAISITGPSPRFPLNKIEEYAALLMSRTQALTGGSNAA